MDEVTSRIIGGAMEVHRELAELQGKRIATEARSLLREASDAVARCAFDPLRPYAASAFILANQIGWIVAENRKIKRTLTDLESRGIMPDRAPTIEPTREGLFKWGEYDSLIREVESWLAVQSTKTEFEKFISSIFWTNFSRFIGSSASLNWCGCFRSKPSS